MRRSILRAMLSCILSTFIAGALSQSASAQSVWKKLKIAALEQAQALLTHRSRSSDVSDEALVFCTSNGTPLASNNLRKRQLRPACLRAELAPISWHALRHTHGTLLHEQGTPLRVAQAQLGHSHLTTTLEVYTHASASAQRHAVEQLENQLFPNVPKFGEIAERPN